MGKNKNKILSKWKIKTEVECKHFASEKGGNLRRWNNKILKKADVVRKMKMPSVSGVARKREGGKR